MKRLKFCVFFVKISFVLSLPTDLYRSRLESDYEVTPSVIFDEAPSTTTTTTDIVPRLIHHEPKQWFTGSHLPPRHRIKENMFYDRFSGDNSKLKPKYCQRNAKCQTLNYSTCMGAKLPYTSTTLDLTDLNSQEIVQEKLYQYQVLRFIPKCWAVIQPFLCSLYMPKCENGKVDLPSKEMCKLILNPCKILYNTTFFPEFMKCEDQRLFPSNCKNDVRELKFNVSGQCLDPLVQTESPSWFYEDVEGCGLRCKDPLYTDIEHKQIHTLVIWAAGICLLFNAFTVATFAIDWKSANKYPALVIFYINLCFLFSCIGWLAQFYGPDSRDDIVCRKDGTLRKSEPSTGENLSCPIIFVLVYYFQIAAMVWFVILTYAWHMSFQALGKIQDRIDKKKAYFHLVAWSLPLILTITTMALGEIDGDSITGICFVGHVNVAARAGLLLVPLGTAMIVGSYFLFRGLLTLIQLKIGSKEIISERASSKIRSTIVRMGLFSLFIVISGITSFACHIYNFANEHLWKESLKSNITCRLTNSITDWIHCRQENRPSVSVLQLHILIFFSTGITMSSWVWTQSTLEAWTRFIRRKFNCEVEEPVKLQKHKVIAQAFAKRKMLYNSGRLSISFHNIHTDPVGMNFELNSMGSNDFSSTWAAALPKFVNRRGALTGVDTNSCSSQQTRRNSMDSEISISVRRVSVESRRNSVDSALSVQYAELKATRKVNGGRRHRHHRRRRHREFSRRLSKTGPLFARRESSTSLDSQLGTHLLNVLTKGNDVKDIVPNLKRRTASAGLDEQQISSMFSKGKLVIPFLPGQSELSEDENVSLTISESKFNLVVNGQRSLKNKDKKGGPRIEELSSDQCSKKSDQQSRSSRKSHKRDSRKHRKSDRYKTNSDDCEAKKYSEDSSYSSSCPELSKLAVQSSLNSGVSIGTQHNCEKNRGSKQSKTSIDVGVQANAREIATQTFSAYDIEITELNKSIDAIQNSRSRSQCVSQGTQMSPKSIRSSRESPVLLSRDNKIVKESLKDKLKRSDDTIEKNLDKIKKNKKKYKNCGSAIEMESLNKLNSKKSKDFYNDDDSLLKDSKCVKIVKKKS